MVYRKRYWNQWDNEALLKALEECRRSCIVAHTTAPISGEVYKAVSVFQASLDDLAGVLTGDRTHFHLKGHSTHGGPKAPPV